MTIFCWKTIRLAKNELPEMYYTSLVLKLIICPIIIMLGGIGSIGTCLYYLWNDEAPFWLLMLFIFLNHGQALWISLYLGNEKKEQIFIIIKKCICLCCKKQKYNPNSQAVSLISTYQ